MFRFNPHLIAGECETSFLDRLKTLAQVVRDVIAKQRLEEQATPVPANAPEEATQDPANAPPVMSICYMFYGTNS